jgi:hypothetical protein
MWQRWPKRVVMGSIGRPTGDPRSNGPCNGNWTSAASSSPPALAPYPSCARSRAVGYRVAGGTPEKFLQRVADLNLPLTLDETLSPVRKVMEVLDQELGASRGAG